MASNGIRKKGWASNDVRSNATILASDSERLPAGMGCAIKCPFEQVLWPV